MACLAVIKTEVYIHSAPGTIHDGQDDLIYVGRTWSYRVYREPETILSYDETIYLSYAGSTVTNGIEFVAPKTVVILAGKNYVDYEITVNIHENAYQKFIYTEATSQLYETCGVISNQILSVKSTPVTYSDGSVSVLSDAEMILTGGSVYGGCVQRFVPIDLADDCHNFFRAYPMEYTDVEYTFK